jgi:transcriptional regulator with XRE-family HTH domain
MVLRDLTTPEAAMLIGCSRAHLYNALIGRTPPSELVRAKLPGLLDASLDELFDAELLGRTYSGTRRRGSVQ